MSIKIVIFFPTSFIMIPMAYCFSMIDRIYSRALTIDGPRKDKNLVFFSLTTCPMCKKGRKYLEEMGYAFKIVYVDKIDLTEKEQLKEELSARYGMRVAFPALLVDERRIVLGFFRDAWQKALGEDQHADE